MSVLRAAFAAALVAGQMATASTPAVAVEVVSARLASLPAPATPSGSSESPAKAISADGRYVLFGNIAGDVVASPADGNDASDVFVRDLQLGTTTLVSVNLAGTAAGNGSSTPAAISSNGRYVLFESNATDLVALTDANGGGDVFIRDLQLGTTALVSVRLAGGATGDHGAFGAGMSPDGRYVVFSSHSTDLVVGDPNGNFYDAFARDLQTGVTVRASNSASRPSLAIDISDDGRYVLFESDGSDLAGADVNGALDVFRRDLQTSTTQLVSCDPTGVTTGNGASAATAMSADGRFALFRSGATNLVATPDGNGGVDDVFVRDLQVGATTLVSINAAGAASGNQLSVPAGISDDGRYVAFYGRANDLVAGDAGQYDVFVRDLQTATTSLASVDSGGTKGNGDSFAASMTPDGRFVLFLSEASNLVPGDTNGTGDAFLRDRQLGTTVLVSVTPGGQAGGGAGVALTTDGRYVVLGGGSDLASGDDLNGLSDVFVRDVQLATTTLASVRGALPVPATGSGAAQLWALSDDGRHVVFGSEANELVDPGAGGLRQVYVRDLGTGTTRLASANAAGTGGVNRPTHGWGVSHQGRYVLFDTTATDVLAPGIDVSLRWDVFVRDVTTGVTELVSVTAAGGATGNQDSEAVSITPSGRFVLFASRASNLVAGDANGTWDVFLRDRQLGVTNLVSVNVAGTASANASSVPYAVSPNGRHVLFTSNATDLAGMPAGAMQQVYVRDRQTGTTSLVSVNAAGTAGGNSHSFGDGGAITADGRYVLFWSYADDLVAGDANADADIFVRDRQAGTTTLVSRNSAGTGSANGHSEATKGLSADGRFVLFGSAASDLVPNDANGTSDVFRRDLMTSTTVLISVNSGGSGSGNAGSAPLSMSADGTLVAFASSASDLVGGDTNGRDDVFLRDVQAGTTILLSDAVLAERPNPMALVAANGTRVAFDATALLVANDFNAKPDVFATTTGRPLPTLPFADAFELGDLTAWATYQP